MLNAFNDLLVLASNMTWETKENKQCWIGTVWLVITYGDCLLEINTEKADVKIKLLTPEEAITLYNSLPDRRVHPFNSKQIRERRFKPIRIGEDEAKNL